jgi:hypothetical protein
MFGVDHRQMLQDVLAGKRNHSSCAGYRQTPLLMWWGRPDLNRRPLPNDGAKPKSTGFFKTAPEIRHPLPVSKPIHLLSGARRLNLSGLRPHLPEKTYEQILKD